MASLDHHLRHPGKKLALQISLAGSVLLFVLLLVAGKAAMPAADNDEAGVLISAQLGHTATAYLVEQDKLALQALVNELAANALVKHASIVDPNQETLVEAGTADNNSPHYRTTIELHNATLGYADVTLDNKDAPSVSIALLLFMALVFFGLQYAMLYRRLQNIDHVVAQTSKRLAQLQGGVTADIDKDPLGTINSLVGELLNHLPAPTPPPAELEAAVFIATPDLAHWRKPLSDEISNQGLKNLETAIEGVGRQFGAQLVTREGGYILLFRLGHSTPLRALGAARMLREQLDKLEDLPPWAIAVHAEANGAENKPAQLRKLDWHQSCADILFTAKPGPIIVSREALSQESINQQVKVEQDEQHDYRITDYNPKLDQLLAPLLAQ